MSTSGAGVPRCRTLRSSEAAVLEAAVLEAAVLEAAVLEASGASDAYPSLLRMPPLRDDMPNRKTGMKQKAINSVAEQEYRYEALLEAARQ